MNALTQYIELYEQHRDLICQHSPEFLNARREAALARLKALGRLPERGDEGFEKISVNDMFAPDYGLNLARRSFDADPRGFMSCGMPEGSYVALIVNDSYVPLGASRALPEGVEVMSLAEAAKACPEVIPAEIAPSDNPLVAINDLLVQDGVFIRVGRDVVLDKPLQVLSVFNTAMPSMAVRRVVIVVERGAKARVLLCDHPRVQTVEYLNSRVVEASVAEDASLEVYDLEESTPLTRRAAVFASAQRQGSSVSAVSVFLNGGMTRNEYFPRQLADNCHTRLGGIVIGGGAEIVDNATYITHDHCHCSSEQLFKYALFDSAQGSFEGNVTVAPGAEYTEAHQTNRNLLASPNARMHTMPQLVIYCDEVKASHGAATGQIDENALFYMRSRGIPAEEARMMLINAFMTDVLDSVAHEPLRERLRHLVDKRLRGCDTVCSGCAASTND